MSIPSLLLFFCFFFLPCSPPSFDQSEHPVLSSLLTSFFRSVGTPVISALLTSFLKSEHPVDAVALQHATVTTSSSSAPLFRVLTPHFAAEFGAASFEERKQWMLALRRNVPRKCFFFFFFFLRFFSEFLSEREREERRDRERGEQ